MTLSLTQEELALLVAAGLLVATRRSEDGRVTEYRLTHAGRTLVAR